MLISGRSKDIDYIDEDPSQLNGVKHTEIVMDSDERVQVKVSKLPKKHDLMQLQWFHKKNKTKKQTKKKLSKFILHFYAIDAAQWTISYNIVWLNY